MRTSEDDVGVTGQKIVMTMTMTMTMTITMTMTMTMWKSIKDRKPQKKQKALVTVHGNHATM